MPKKPRKPFFERLKTGLEEGIAHARTEINLKTVDVDEDQVSPNPEQPSDCGSAPIE